MTRSFRGGRVFGGLVAWVVVGAGASEVMAQAVHNLTQGTNHATIQEAIDAAVDGDEIEADPGAYIENIDFLGKDLTVRSTDPLDADVVADTLIDGGGLDTVVTLSVGTISGFTITGGANSGFDAGGVHATGTAVVSHNVLIGNVAEMVGGGVTAEDTVVVHNNTITNNIGVNRGGGVNAKGSSMVIDNYIAFNSALSGGGAIRARENCTIRNNTIVFNSSEDTGGGVLGGGGILAEDSSVLRNNLIAFSTDGVGIHVDPGSSVNADYNCVFGNMDGEYSGHAVAGPNDLNVDPLLDTDGLHLTLASPCIDVGDPFLVPLDDEVDIDGQTRVYLERVDMGADEARDCNGNGVEDADDIAGGTSTDCDKNGIPDECIFEPGAGIVFLTGEDSDDNGHCQGTDCGSLFPNVFSFCIANSGSPGTGILAIGVNNGTALTALNSWNDPANGGPNAEITILTDTNDIMHVNFSAYAMIYIPSVSSHTAGGITSSQLDALNTRQSAIITFINSLGGALLALTEGGVSNAYGWLPIPIEFETQEHQQVCPTEALTDDLAPDATCVNMSHCCFHNIFTGPPGFLGLKVLSISTDDPVDQVIMLGGVNVALSSQARLQPSDATDVEGGTHLLRLTLSESENPCVPIPDVVVTFNIISGPNEGVTENSFTDENGVATFVYFDAGGPGTDEIQAFMTDPGTDLPVASNVATMSWLADCNGNGVPDSIDLQQGNSSNCNTNGVPDECDIAEGTSGDCNENEIPDECDIADETSLDCNENVIPDECDLAGGTSSDCQPNDVPDECEGEDCNHNEIPDDCDIAGGTAEDENKNGVPDDCEVGLECCDTPALCDGDVNGDGAVDPLDSGSILARFGLDPGKKGLCQYDPNCDGAIDPLDAGYVLARFGGCNPVVPCPTDCHEPFRCPGEGDCCLEGGNGTPGCNDEACCEFICEIDPFCCDTMWDGFCAADADESCEACTGGGEGPAM